MVCKNIEEFIFKNNEKINKLNIVINQLSDLELSDNSAIVHLISQKLKYEDIIVNIKSKFDDINQISNFTL